MEIRKFTHICPVRVPKNPSDPSSNCGNCNYHDDEKVGLVGACDRLKPILKDIQVDWRAELGNKIKPVPTMQERIAKIEELKVETGKTFASGYNMGRFDALNEVLNILKGEF